MILGEERNGQMEDEKIVDLYWRRQDTAITETQTKYGAAFYSVTYGILRCREDAEECVNDTYVKLWGAIPPDQPDNLGAYGCRVARNTALDRLKSYKTEKRAHNEVVYEELAECIPSDESADRIVDRMALSRAISAFLSSETPERRVMFMRRYFYMDTSRDIGKMLHIPSATVRMTLRRMRKRFKKYLEGEGIGE